MKAMILAAGLGKRMRPLTEHTPKPLLSVGGHYLIEYHLKNLAKAGFKEVVINTHWLAEQIPAVLGDGARWGLNISYSHEPDLLETAGGIINALPLLVEGSFLNSETEQEGVFLVINGDVFCDLDLAAWIKSAPALNTEKNAYLALVDNPDHHPEGDFIFRSEEQPLALIEPESMKADAKDENSFTYSGLALFHCSFFKGLSDKGGADKGEADKEQTNSVQTGPQPLGPLLKAAISEHRVLGTLLSDFWLDVGTPERFEKLKSRLA